MKLYDRIIVKPVYAIGDFFNRQVEKGLIDWIVNGSGRLVQYGSRPDAVDPERAGGKLRAADGARHAGIFCCTVLY